MELVTFLIILSIVLMGLVWGVEAVRTRIKLNKLSDAIRIEHNERVNRPKAEALIQELTKLNESLAMRCHYLPRNNAIKIRQVPWDNYPQTYSFEEFECKVLCPEREKRLKYLELAAEKAQQQEQRPTTVNGTYNSILTYNPDWYQPAPDFARPESLVDTTPVKKNGRANWPHGKPVSKKKANSNKNSKKGAKK